MTGLKGKNVLVTGGTSGIGQAIAVRFAREGSNVAINYLKSADEAAETDCLEDEPDFKEAFDKNIKKLSAKFGLEVPEFNWRS